MGKIYLYCDGGCRGNQNSTNIGGWGALLQYGETIKEIRGSTRNTTNNVMELTACIEGLKIIKDKSIPVEVAADSQYVVKGVNEWMHGWIKNGWRNSKKEPVANKELWKELLEVKSQFSDITFLHCKGHSDNEGNNRADELANIAMDEEVG